MVACSLKCQLRDVVLQTRLSCTRLDLGGAKVQSMGGRERALSIYRVCAIRSAYWRWILWQESPPAEEVRPSYDPLDPPAVAAAVHLKRSP